MGLEFQFEKMENVPSLASGYVRKCILIPLNCTLKNI